MSTIDVVVPRSGCVVMAVVSLLTGCDDGTLSAGGSPGCPVIDNPAATLSGYQQFPPQQKIGDPRAQDPTYVYLVAGRWMADQGTLLVDAGRGPFADADGVVFESAGTYDEGGGQLHLQFTHLVPVNA